MWIVVNALLLSHIRRALRAVRIVRAWLIANLPNDRRVILVVVGFCFGALLEGVAGFGTPCHHQLPVNPGRLPPLEALVFVLIFNTAPVAFGALGAPVTVLGAVTGLPARAWGDDRRQLPVIAADPTVLRDGPLRRHALDPRALAVLLVAGASFALSQFIASNFLDYSLTMSWPRSAR